jgi:hypothetical protein
MEKPSLTLVSPPITVEKLVALFRKLTGKEPTEADLAEARAILERPAEPGTPSPSRRRPTRRGESSLPS